MLTEKVEKTLNDQLELEAASSQVYLAMASWAESQGLGGVADFMYAQADEERMHMLKLMRYINERGGRGIVPALVAPSSEYGSIDQVFETLLNHEVAVSNAINGCVAVCMDERDFTTQNFLQWYVAEQLEEEALARTIMDKLKLIGGDKGGLYLFDRDISGLTVQSAAADTAGA